MSLLVVVRGGGDLASGAAYRLQRAGLHVLVSELPQPLAVRRLVSFAEAIYSGSLVVDGVSARRAVNWEAAQQILERGEIPVLVDPLASICEDPRLHRQYDRLVVVDGRMTKRPPAAGINHAALLIGLGPGFEAGVNCQAVIETNRGHSMGRVIWEGAPELDTGMPEAVAQQRANRVLRAPADGILESKAEICDHLEPGELIATVGGVPLAAPFKGVLRGLMHHGLTVRRGLKIGDLDPRDDPALCTCISDKALAVGGGVLEALLSRAELRPFLWD